MSWEARIARARRLAAESPAASGILTFYAELAEYQRSLGHLDRRGAANAVAPFLRWLRQHAPQALAEAAGQAERRTLDEWEALMQERLATGGCDDSDSASAFIIEAVLQACAPFESAFRRTDGARPSRCPHCGSHPVAAALREEGHGARRALVCSLCFAEWNYPRVHCPACGEQRFDALPVYTADSVAHVRIDACDQCRTYVKTIDLTKDGLAVPVVDDLATVALDLWARERGYRRLYPNLLRL